MGKFAELADIHQQVNEINEPNERERWLVDQVNRFANEQMAACKRNIWLVDLIMKLRELVAEEHEQTASLLTLHLVDQLKAGFYEDYGRLPGEPADAE